MLYDFDDYTEPSTFEAERYAEVQATTRALALSVINFIKKTKVETITVHGSKFPPLPPLPPLSRSSSVVSSLSSSRPSTTTAANATTTSGGGRRRMPSKSLHVDRSISSPPPPLSSSVPPSVSALSDGLSTSTDSFEPGSLNTVPIHPLRLHPAKHSHDYSVRSRRSIVSNTTSRSRMSQISIDSVPPPAYTASGELISFPKPPLDAHMPGHLSNRSLFSFDTNDAASELPSPATMSSHNRTQQSLSPARSPADTDTRGPVNYTAFPIPRSSTGSSQRSGTHINAWVSDQAEASKWHSAHHQSGRTEPPSAEAIQALQSLTIEVNGSSPERTKMSPFSQTTSLSSVQGQTSPPPPPKETIPTRTSHVSPGPTLTPLSLPATALEPYQQPAESRRNFSVPIPLTSISSLQEEWQAETRTITSDRASTSAGFSTSSRLSHPSDAYPQPREPDTAIDLRSSLYALAGFCAGATQFRLSNHEEGVRKVAGHVAGVSTATARCSSCSYGHAFTELELDVHDGSPRATFPRPAGVLFRMRLLYKCHLVSQRPSEAFYGCIFCAQLGNVVYEGDATVFRSSDDLFHHLARHPQPLPDIPRVTVLYGKDILTTDPRVNDFDLWLGEEPKPLPEVPLAIDLAKLPVATATKNHVQRYMEKKLARPEGKSADRLLQFFVGARIIGVEFPAAFAGKWCTGFHNGEWGYFQSKLVELEKPWPGRLDAPPMQFQGNGGGGSNVTVVTKFKWDSGASSENGNWLSFDKGEKITNVAWPVLWEGVGGGREGWCWSGTNVKGRFGLFPRSHVDEATLRDDARTFTSDAGAGIGTVTGWIRKEGLGARKAKSLFRIKRRGSIDSSRSGHSGGVVEIIR